MNSAINPIVYGFRTPIYKNLWTKCCCLQNYAAADVSRREESTCSYKKAGSYTHIATADIAERVDNSQKNI